MALTFRRFVWLWLIVSLGLTACGRSLETGKNSHDSNTVGTVARSVDPSRGSFTCPGVSDTSVEAMFEDVKLNGSEIRDPSGSIEHLECWGESHGSTVFYSESGRVTPYSDHSHDYRGPGSEKYSVPEIEGASGDYRTMPEGVGASSLIICGDVFVLVRIYSNRAPLKGDLKENVKNISLSMTPWACKGEAIPGIGLTLSHSRPNDGASTAVSNASQSTT